MKQESPLPKRSAKGASECNERKLAMGGFFAKTIAVIMAMVLVLGLNPGLTTQRAWADEGDLAPASLTAQADTVKEIAGSSFGDTAQAFAPYYASKTSALTYSVYTPTEIESTGSISKIAFKNDSATSMSGILEIYMGLTDEASLTASTKLAPSEMTRVYSSPDCDLGKTAGWEAITLDSSYAYDGSKNLVVAVFHSSANTSTLKTYVGANWTNKTCLYSGSTAFNSFEAAYAGISTYDIFQDTTNNTYRPAIQLTFTDATSDDDKESYAVTIDAGISHGKVNANVEKAAEGDEVTLTITPDGGYELNELTVCKTNDSNTTVGVVDNKFTMPAYPVTITATFKLISSGNGFDASSDNPTISSQEDWDAFVAAVNGGNSFSGKTVSLKTDVTASTMVGYIAHSSYYPSLSNGNNHVFAGTFDGEKHTVTANINDETTTSSEGPAAVGVFSWVKGSSEQHAAIKNLKVKGSVSSTALYTAGVVGFGLYLDVIDVSSDATVSNTGNWANGYCAAAAILGAVENLDVSNPTVELIGCAARGSVSCSGNVSGGIVGYIGTHGVNIRASYSTATCTDSNNGSGVIVGQIGTSSSYPTMALDALYAAGSGRNGGSGYSYVYGRTGGNYATYNLTSTSCYADSTKAGSATLPSNWAKDDIAVASMTAAVQASSSATAKAEEFVADSGSINNGYPILSWESADSSGGTDPVTAYSIAKANAEHGSFTVTDGENEITTAEAGSTVVVNPTPENANYVVDSVSYTTSSSGSSDVLGDNEVLVAATPVTSLEVGEQYVFIAEKNASSYAMKAEKGTYSLKRTEVSSVAAGDDLKLTFADSAAASAHLWTAGGSANEWTLGNGGQVVTCSFYGSQLNLGSAYGVTFKHNGTGFVSSDSDYGNGPLTMTNEQNEFYLSSSGTVAKAYKVVTAAGDSSTSSSAVDVPLAEGKYSFQMPASDITVSVTFKAIYAVTPTGTESGGTYTMAGGSYTVAGATEGKAAEGATITVSATPATNYVLDTITATYDTDKSVTVTQEGNTGTFDMPAGNVTITVTFKQDTFTITQGTITPTSSGTFKTTKSDSTTEINSQKTGEYVYIIATPASSAYVFDSATVTNTTTNQTVALGTYPVTGIDAYFEMPEGNVSIDVTFRSAAEKTLNLSVEAQGSTARTFDQANESTSLNVHLAGLTKSDSAAVTASDASNLIMQWYVKGPNDSEFKAINDARAAAYWNTYEGKIATDSFNGVYYYSASLATAGVFQYKCVATWTVEGYTTKVAESDVFTVTVNEPAQTLVTEIDSAAKLQAFAASVNAGTDYSAAMVKLTADIDMSGIVSWTPIGTADKPFTGTFDGQKHSIKNLKVTDATTGDKSVFGLFGYIYGGTTVKDFTLDSTCEITSSANTVAGVVARSVQEPGGLYTEAVTPSIQNVRNLAAVTSTASPDKPSDSTDSYDMYSYHAVAGIVGSGVAKVSACANKGAITAASTNVRAAGIYGSMCYADSSVTNCYNIGAISNSAAGSPILGGICTIAVNKSTTGVSACYNAGTVSASNATSANDVAAVAGGGNKNTNNTDSPTDCYYLTGSAAKGAGSHFSGDATVTKTAAELKALYTTLGTEDWKDGATANASFGKYPALSWEEEATTREVAVTITPAAGVQSVSATVDGVEADSPVISGDVYTYTIAKDKALVVTVTPAEGYDAPAALTIGANETSGTITVVKTAEAKYTVTFVDEDGTTVLKAAEYASGTSKDDIVQPEKTPTKASTAEYTYTFDGWEPALADVTANATYKAKYKAEKRQYTITFKNDDGKELSAEKYDYGTAAADIKAPANPTKAADSKYIYEFVGWTPALAQVTGDATYTAIFKSETPASAKTEVTATGDIFAKDLAAGDSIELIVEDVTAEDEDDLASKYSARIGDNAVAGVYEVDLKKRLADGSEEAVDTENVGNLTLTFPVEGAADGANVKVIQLHEVAGKAEPQVFEYSAKAANEAVTITLNGKLSKFIVTVQADDPKDDPKEDSKDDSGDGSKSDGADTDKQGDGTDSDKPSGQDGADTDKQDDGSGSGTSTDQGGTSQDGADSGKSTDQGNSDSKSGSAADTASSGSSAASESKVMYRLYNAFSGEHLHTSDKAEAEGLVAVGWTDEGKGWTAPEKSNTPVYRLYNPFEPLGDHHYTVDRAEYDELVAAGWVGEDVGWYSDDEKGVPLYRAYNPNAYAMGMTGAHHYTADKGEADSLVAVGWIYEDIAWYGVK